MKKYSNYVKALLVATILVGALPLLPLLTQRIHAVPAVQQVQWVKT